LIADAWRAFNSGFDTVNLHHPTAVALFARFNHAVAAHRRAVAAQVEIDSKV